MNKNLIYNYLDELFINPKCELNFNKDYELLLSVMLSAQTTDKAVNSVMDDIYKEYNTLEKLDKIDISVLENKIRKIGFYKIKSKNFKYIVSKIKEIGYVPNDRKFLESLKGVGRKTASVILGILYDVPSFAVDTHVFRVSKRLGISNKNDNVIITEKKLKNYFDKNKWNRVNSQLVLFGRYYCHSRKPKCENCKLKDICKYYKDI